MENDKKQKPALSKTAVMPRCSTCKHWKQNSFFDYDGVINTGTCREIKMKLDFIFHPERIDGYVENIEVNSDFGCVLHNEA